MKSGAIAASILVGTCSGFATNNNIIHNIHSSSTLFNSYDETNNDNSSIERREVLNNIFRGLTAAAAITISSSTTKVNALDFDAFEAAETTKDTQNLIPKLNDDEALCKYGAPGKAMGEACERAKIQRKLPGGVDITGKVDRGDYLVCKYEYPDMVKTRVCKPGKSTLVLFYSVNSSVRYESL